MGKFKWVFGVTAIVAVGVLAGCGGSDDSSPATPPADTNATSNSTPAPDTNSDDKSSDSGADAETVALFNSAGCAGCHTFKPADATGTVGPDLDSIPMDEDQIKTQIENGGGPMPAYASQLSDDEIDSLATMISDAQ